MGLESWVLQAWWTRHRAPHQLWSPKMESSWHDCTRQGSASITTALPLEATAARLWVPQTSVSSQFTYMDWIVTWVSFCPLSWSPIVCKTSPSWVQWQWTVVDSIDLFRTDGSKDPGAPLWISALNYFWGSMFPRDEKRCWWACIGWGGGLRQRKEEPSLLQYHLGWKSGQLVSLEQLKVLLMPLALEALPPCSGHRWVLHNRMIVCVFPFPVGAEGWETGRDRVRAAWLMLQL
jgi:hypothetical protein